MNRRNKQRLQIALYFLVIAAFIMLPIAFWIFFFKECAFVEAGKAPGLCFIAR